MKSYSGISPLWQSLSEWLGWSLAQPVLYWLCTLILSTIIQTPWEFLLLGATIQNLTKYSVHGYLTHFWWQGIKWNKCVCVCVCVCSKQTKIFKPCKYILDSHILSFWQLTSHYQQLFHLITQTNTSWVPGTTMSAIFKLSQFSHITVLWQWVHYINISILQMKKLRFRKIKQLIQGPTTNHGLR